MNFLTKAADFRIFRIAVPNLSTKFQVVRHAASSNSEQTTTYSSSVVNRNPRNLEYLGIASKRKGWKFQYPSREFYHRLLFEQTHRHLVGRVEHTSGKTVVIASTKELAITQYLYGFTDFSAAENIGRVLSQRCRESGITSMVFQCPIGRWHSEKVQVFRQAMIDGGIELTERDEVVPAYEPGINYDDPEIVKNLWQRQQQVYNILPEHRMLIDNRHLDKPRRRRGPLAPKNWWKDLKLIPEER